MTRSLAQAPPEPRVASYQQRCAQRLLDEGRGSAVQATLELTGPLDAGRLRRACQGVAARHEILRQDGAPDGVTCDLSLVPPAARARYRAQTARRSATRLAGAGSRAAVQVALLHWSPNLHHLVLTCSPLVADAGSLAELARELVDDYDGAPAADGELPYADVAAWQEGLLAEEDAQPARRFWTRQRDERSSCADPLPFEGDVVSPAPDDRATASLRIGTERVAPGAAPAWWLACWQALFHRLSGGAPVVCGVVASARRYGELQDVVGPLDRALPVPSRASGRASLAQTAGAVEEALRERVAWLEYYDEPMDRERVAAGSWPWQIGFAHVRWPALSSKRLRARIVDAAVETSGAPIALVVHEDAESGATHVRLHFHRRRFVPADVVRLGQALVALASDARARPAAPLDELSLVDVSDRDRIVTGWNATQVGWPDAATSTSLAAWLERQAARTPDALAVWAEDGTWSYAALHAQANQIARRLRRLGVGAESRVGVWLPRSRALVAALVGVVKAGAAYVPLDPSYPAARLAFQVSDAKVAVVLTDLAHAPDVPAGSHAIEALDAADAPWRSEETTTPAVDVVPEQLAYVIYTSGSTGQPKGAMNTHRGVANRLTWMQATYDLTPADRVLQKTSASFDVSVWEFFWPLGTGAAIVVARPGGQQDPAYLADVIGRAGVTVLHFVPAMLEVFAAAGGLAACGGVRLIVSSGEALPGPLAARCLSAWTGRLENLYGPTEAAIDVTWQSCTSEVVSEGVVPIGRPVANTAMYVLDAADQPAPVGVRGELAIGGIQVGRGYLGRADLTAERFAPDPFGAPGARLYRTGDVARYRADGAIEYVGRADYQVKLHGNRIELGEIEAALRRQAGVREAVVIVREDRPGEKRLAGYLVVSSASQPPAIDVLQAALRAQLPDYMVPAAFVALDALPVTPNGKVDRRALPAPSDERPALAAAYAPPRTAVETVLAQIWTDVLRLDRVGIHDNFFALGGDSILSLQVVARARQAGWRLAPRTVFEHPTIAALAAFAQVSTGSRADQAPLVGPVPLTPIQHWFFSHRLLRPHHFNQAVRIELPVPALAVLDEAWLALQRHHDALRFRYTHGPAGWQQIATGPETAAHVATIDLTGVPTDVRMRMEERVAAAAQASLDLTDGPLARAVVLLAGDRPAHALLVVHHLVVDGVSWRVLVEDFELASRQLHAGRPVVLPPKTSSVRQWADALASAAKGDELGAELPVWVQTSEPAAVLPREREGGANTIRRSRSHQASLGREDTQALLQELPARGAGQVLDVLLAALVQTLSGWTDEPTWRVDLEGHGRETLAADVDVSRTVGWFTSIYPVRLTALTGLSETVRAVRATLRALPQNGIGYGMLRYLDAPSAEVVRDAPPAEILVNYLGQVDQAFSPAGALRLGAGPTGPMRDRDAPREYVLELNGIVVNGQLRVTWTYSDRFEPATIARLADRFLGIVRAVVAEALAAGEDDGAVAADFRDLDLDDAELRRIAELLEGTETSRAAQ